jgi:competence protein ComEC
MSKALLWRLIIVLLIVILAMVSAVLGVWLRQRRGHRKAPQTVVAFLDVGDGDCTLVRDTTGTTIVVDGGSAASAAHVVDVLRRFHVKAIDLLVLTTSAQRSIGGVPALADAFPIHQVWESADDSPNAARRAALEAIRHHAIPLRVVQAGDNLQVGAATFWKVLWPPEHGPAARRDSLILEMDYGRTRFLFAGTAGERAEDDLVADLGEKLGCTKQYGDLILQAPRGGADNGTSAELLRNAAPSVAVISGSGGPNDPARATLHRLEVAGVDIRRTDTMGTVIVLTDGHSMPTVTAEHL